MKNTIYIILLLLLVSSCGLVSGRSGRKARVDSIQPPTATIMIDSIFPDIKFIDSATIYTLLKQTPDSTKEILGSLGALNPYNIYKEAGPFTLHWYDENFDTTPAKELILHFHSERPLDIIYVLKKEADTYHILPPFQFGDEGSYNTEPAIVDLKNKSILVKSNIWGTCTGGYAWEVYWLENNEFKKVLTFAGEHGNGSCGQEEIKSSYKIETAYTFIKRDSIVLTGKVTYHTYRLSGNPEKRTNLSTEHATIKMTYTFDPALGTFRLYSSRGNELTQNPIWAQDFWELIQEKKL